LGVEPKLVAALGMRVGRSPALPGKRHLAPAIDHLADFSLTQREVFLILFA
jgi:hypothetical protein